MSRRKRTFVPQRLDGAKIQRLSWNMTDIVLDGNCSNHVIVDNEIRIVNEDDQDDGVASCSSSPTTLPFYDDMTHSQIRHKLNLSNKIASESSVGLIGVFSAMIINIWQQDIDYQSLCLSNSSTGKCLIMKICKPTDAGDVHDTNLCSKEVVEKLDFIGINATTDQINALEYLSANDFVRVVINQQNNKEPLNQRIGFSVYLSHKAISKVAFAFEDPCSKRKDKMFKVLMEWLHGNCRPYSTSRSTKDCERDDKLKSLFDAFKRKRDLSGVGNSQVSSDNRANALSCESLAKENKNLEKLQHPSLVPCLRKYQKKSVKWMIERETMKNAEFTAKDICRPHPLWKAINVGGDSMVYYNPFTGRISTEPFYNKGYPSGGILADEMGLGKTVEVLACILNNPMIEETRNNSQGSSDDKNVDVVISEKLCSDKSPVPTAALELQQDLMGERMLLECNRSFVDYLGVAAVPDSREGVVETCLNNQGGFCDSSEQQNTMNNTPYSLTQQFSLNYVSGSEKSHRSEEKKKGSDEVERQKSSPTVLVEEDCPVSCICGERTASSQDEILKCCSCTLVQHSKCIGIKSMKKKYVCPDCAVKMPLMDSKATLIISPVTIAHQWLNEIHRHILPGSLDVMVYEGVAKQGFIYPSVLADNDIILTTYDVLKKDFHHLASKKNEKSFRHRKRYATWPCPLTCIKFWRICLDEAQMVENTTAKAAETALNLAAVHRWCVTGTPIQRGIEDLYGLLLFLGVEPYFRRTWWKKLLLEPFLEGNYQPLLDVLYHIMWRTAKKDVINEINLPKQEESVKWLNFTPVEDHFYRRQHEVCSTFALKELNKFNESMTTLNSLDKTIMQKVLGPLLRLRQACCHPQAVRGGFVSFQKSTITMDQLLETLMAKAKKECEEAHRLFLCAMNGLAGTYILEENWQTAVEIYREAMGSWREHEALIKTDSLQKLHTLHNLHDVLSRDIPGCSHTLRDDFLKQEACELREKYLGKWKDQVFAAEADVAGAKQTHYELRQKVDFKCPWWITFFEDIRAEDKKSTEKKLTEKLLGKVKDDLAVINNATELGALSMADSFSDLCGLQYLLVTKFEAIEIMEKELDWQLEAILPKPEIMFAQLAMKSQESLFDELYQLLVDPSKEIILSAAECCLRPTSNTRPQRCLFCKADDIFAVHESLLFGHQGVNNVDPESQQISGGLRGETETERALKSIFNVLKAQRKHDQTYLDLQLQAQSHFEYLDSMKKNFKTYRQLWFALRERVSALDELEMCTMRLRFRYPCEIVEENQLHIINPVEIGTVQMKFRSDKVVASSDLRKYLGQLLYLKNLAKTQTEDDGENCEPCPVCTKPLGFQWSVFSCGHCLCCQCIWVLLERPGLPGRVARSIKCPLCRTQTMIQDISYVSTVTQTEEDKELVVKGSHSTKIEAIVRTLLKIQKTDPRAKTLVFSTWQDVLDHVSYALTENAIEYRCIRGRKDFQDNLEDFKAGDHIPVLLLPLQSGSNGLNIIEATHVILVEPSLNPSLEMQAVGRVHRIGQTKPTFIHRLLIGNTVEEKIMTFLQNKTVSGIRCGTRKTDKDNIPLTVGELASFFEPTEPKLR